ncbi:MAG: flagellar M-ring protein FliF C-terminal domain-containing protein, partial [Candidatus Eremiobacterota bacterium]
GEYVNTKKARKVEVPKTTQRVVDRSPRVRRISCSVAVDNIPEEQRAQIAGLVREAAGLDESRGDTLTVVSMPFAKAMDQQIKDMASAMATGTTPRPAAPGMGLSPQIVAMMMFFPAMILLALVAVFLLKQHRVQQDKSAILLGASSGATASDISDLLNEKSGKSQTIGETRVNTTEQLEKLAKEKPTKVAEMLKSTWLSQGG